MIRILRNVLAGTPFAFYTEDNIWIFYGKNQKQALKDCVEYFEHLCKDAREKNFSRDSEFYDNFTKVIDEQHSSVKMVES